MPLFGRLPGGIKRAIVALTACHFWLAWQMASWGPENNRYFAHWSLGDGLALISLVVLLAIAAFAVGELPRIFGWQKLARAVDYGFLVVAAMGAASLTRNVEGSAWLGWALLALVPLAYLAPGLRIIQRSATACLFLSPVIPVMWIQVLTYGTSWADPPQRETRFPSERQASFPHEIEDATPVFFFVFDAWSYQHLIERSGVAGSENISSDFPNLRRLAATADFHTNARSLVPTTPVALPSIIYQRDLTFRPLDGVTYIGDTKSERPSQAVPSLFQLAKQQGYYTALMGFHLPYAAILGDQVDDYWLWTDQPHGRSFTERLAVKFVSNFLYLNDPLSRALLSDGYRELDSRHWFDMNRSMRSRALDLIARAPANSFLFFHWPLPHPPFVFEADGRYAGRYSDSRMEGSTADYRKQFHYLDRLVGELIDSASKTGRFDSALLVFTSDHGWIQDPDAASRNLRHVPLIIKHPGQTAGRKIDEPIANYGLMQILRPAFGSAATAAQTMPRLEAPPSTPSEE